MLSPLLVSLLLGCVGAQSSFESIASAAIATIPELVGGAPSRRGSGVNGLIGDVLGNGVLGDIFDAVQDADRAKTVIKERVALATNGQQGPVQVFEVTRHNGINPNGTNKRKNFGRNRQSLPQPVEQDRPALPRHESLKPPPPLATANNRAAHAPLTIPPELLTSLLTSAVPLASNALLSARPLRLPNEQQVIAQSANLQPRPKPSPRTAFRPKQAPPQTVPSGSPQFQVNGGQPFGNAHFFGAQQQWPGQALPVITAPQQQYTQQAAFQPLPPQYFPQQQQPQSQQQFVPPQAQFAQPQQPPPPPTSHSSLPQLSRSQLEQYAALLASNPQTQLLAQALAQQLLQQAAPVDGSLLPTETAQPAETSDSLNPVAPSRAETTAEVVKEPALRQTRRRTAAPRRPRTKATTTPRPTTTMTTTKPTTTTAATTTAESRSDSVPAVSARNQSTSSRPCDCVQIDFRALEGSWVQALGNVDDVHRVYSGLYTLMHPELPVQTIMPSCAMFHFGSPNQSIAEQRASMRWTFQTAHSNGTEELIGSLETDDHKSLQMILENLGSFKFSFPVCILKVGHSKDLSRYDYLVMTQLKGNDRCRSVYVLARDPSVFFDEANAALVTHLRQAIVAKEIKPIAVIPFTKECTET